MPAKASVPAEAFPYIDRVRGHGPPLHEHAPFRGGALVDRSRIHHSRAEKAHVALVLRSVQSADPCTRGLRPCH
jgi:hypothetical protein